MATFDRLIRSTNLQLNRSFNSATRQFITEAKTNPRTPVDTKALRGGIEQRDRVVTGPRKKITVTSTTTNRGFDYPSYLNSRSRRYLNGSSNIHLMWWRDVMSEATWGRIMRANLEGRLG